MRTKFAGLMVFAALALTPLGGAVEQASAHIPPCNCTSTTTTAPNGDKITRLTFSDGTVMIVVVKAGAADALK